MRKEISVGISHVISTGCADCGHENQGGRDGQVRAELKVEERPCTRTRQGQNLMKYMVRSGIVLVALCFAFSLQAKADNIHLCGVSTGCNAGSVIPIGTTTAYVTGNPTGQELFLAILTPVADTSGGWNGGTLWSALNPPIICNKCTYPTLSSAISQELTGAGIVAASFNVSDYDLGVAWTVNGQQITLPNEPVGTMFMAFTQTSGGDLNLVTPWSSSFVTTPEPSSLLLLGIGLLGVLGLTKAKP